MGEIAELLSKGRATLLRHICIRMDLLLASLRRADIAIFHEFVPPPGGGGNQFLRALWEEFERKGFKVENNTISFTTRACLFNSYNFDFDRLRRFRRRNCRMVHRVDGPVSVYRSLDDGTDKKIFEMNQESADATVFQSKYSVEKHADLGMRFRNPVVIHNAVSSRIFHPYNRIGFDRNRKIRIFSASWSDNVNKGSDVYKWLEDKLDWERFEYTFAGRSPVAFRFIRMLKSQPLTDLANLMRQHDIFLSASRYECCPNVILEALSCGMPVIYHNSGGSPEVVGEAGLGFTSMEEIPELLDRLVHEYEVRQKRIKVPSLNEVAEAYLRVLGLDLGHQ